MSSGKVRFGQIDGLMEDTQALANQDDVLAFDVPDEEFKPVSPFTVGYGSEFHFSENLNTVVTSNTLYQNQHTFLTGTLPVGTYLIMWSFTFGLESTGNPELVVQVQANGGDLYDDNFVYPNQANSSVLNRYKSMSMHEFVLASEGTIELTLDLRRAGTNKLVAVYDSHFTLIRVI